MTNYSQMRNNMILGQFLPGLIKNKNILKFFGEISREDLLPEGFKNLAYSDLNIKATDKRHIPSPFNSARIIQEAQFTGKEVVLLIGANYGYEAIIISRMVDTIVAIEEDKELSKVAEANLKGLNIENLVFVSSKHEIGHKKLGPYDIIISLDSQFLLKEELIEQLVNGGKLFFCESQKLDLKESKLNVIYKSNKSFIKQELFDINIPTTLDTGNDNNKFKFN